MDVISELVRLRVEVTELQRQMRALALSPAEPECAPSPEQLPKIGPPPQRSGPQPKGVRSGYPREW
jgi:hypothetical protein